MLRALADALSHRAHAPDPTVEPMCRRGCDAGEPVRTTALAERTSARRQQTPVPLFGAVPIGRRAAAAAERLTAAAPALPVRRAGAAAPAPGRRAGAMAPPPETGARAAWRPAAGWPAPRPRAGEPRAAWHNPMQQPATGLRPGGERMAVGSAVGTAAEGIDGVAPGLMAPAAAPTLPDVPARPRAGQSHAVRHNPMHREPVAVGGAGGTAAEGTDGVAPGLMAPAAAVALPAVPARPRAGQPRAAWHNPMQQPATGLRPGGEPVAVVGAVGTVAAGAGGATAGLAMPAAAPGLPAAPARPRAGQPRAAWHNPMQQPATGLRPGGEPVAVVGAVGTVAAGAGGAAAGLAMPAAAPRLPAAPARPRTGQPRATWHNPMQQPATGLRPGGEPGVVSGAPGVATADAGRAATGGPDRPMDRAERCSHDARPPCARREGTPPP